MARSPYLPSWSGHARDLDPAPGRAAELEAEWADLERYRDWLDQPEAAPDVSASAMAWARRIAELASAELYRRLVRAYAVNGPLTRATAEVDSYDPTAEAEGPSPLLERAPDGDR